MKLTRINVKYIALYLLFIISTLSLADNSWEMKTVNGMTLYTQHGSAVHGHKFGFVKKDKNCDMDYLYIQWSSYDDIKQFEGEFVHMFLSNEIGDGGRISPLMELVRKFGVMDIAVFLGPESGQVATDNLILFLENSKELTVSILKDQEVYENFDIPKDHFDLSKFKDARESAYRSCKKI